MMISQSIKIQQKYKIIYLRIYLYFILILYIHMEIQNYYIMISQLLLIIILLKRLNTPFFLKIELIQNLK